MFSDNEARQFASEEARETTNRPKKAVRFQVYNAKDMETLRSMRHNMEEKFEKITQRSRSPAASRAELLQQIKLNLAQYQS